MFKTLSAEDYRHARRVAIIGAPNTFKTSSLLTWPHDLAIMSYPGEKGWETIPLDEPGVTAIIWEEMNPEKVSPHAVVREVESKTWEVLARPGLVTFAGDGLHKLYYWYYRRRRADIAGWTLVKDDPEANEQKLDIAAYGSPTGGAYADVMLYLSKVLQSPVPYVAITMWEEPELDDPSNFKSKSAHIFPALPGKLAKHIVGEFGAVVSSEVSLPDPKGRRTGLWQIRPAGKVWGVGVKIDPKIAVTLPEKIDQDFKALESLLKGGKA